MKVYNIKNSKKFFEKLNDCKGTVTLLNEDGEQMPLSHSMTTIDGTIRQLELKFQDNQDSVEILNYLLTGGDCAAA